MAVFSVRLRDGNYVELLKKEDMDELIRKQISVELDEAEAKFCKEHTYEACSYLYDDFLEELYKELSNKFSVDVDDVREIWIDNVVEQI